MKQKPTHNHIAGTNDEKPVSKASKQLGKYATAEEAAKAKNEPLITLLKKLDIKVVTKS